MCFILKLVKASSLNYRHRGKVFGLYRYYRFLSFDENTIRTVSVFNTDKVKVIVRFE